MDTRKGQQAMHMKPDQEKLYSDTMENAYEQLEVIERNIEEELQKTRQKLNELKEKKKVFQQIYASAERLLELNP